MSENEKKVAAGTAENGGITEEKEKAVLEKYDREAKTRTFVNPTLAMAFKVFCIVVTAYHLIFAAGIWTPRTLQHRAIHVAMMLILSFAMYPATKTASRKTIAWYDYILMALSAVTAIYMYVNYNTIVNRAGVVNGTDVIVGEILTVLVLEATRRVCGAALPILLLIGQKLNQDTGKIEVIRTGFAAGAITAIFAVIGVALLSIAVEGHLFKKVSLPIRVLAIIGAFLLMTPAMTFNLVGIAIAAAVIVVQKASGGKATPAAA